MRRHLRPTLGHFLTGLLCGFVAIATYTTLTRSATPSPEQPPAGAVLVIVAQSDGLTWLPVGQAVVPPTACQP